MTVALVPRRRSRREMERVVPISAPARVELAAADAECAEHDVERARHTLERVKVERQLLREELDLEADRIQGHADLAGRRAEADTKLALLEAARLNPELAASDTVRARRQELGLSQSALASRAGVGVRKVSDLEAGRGGADDHLRRIARVLDLDYHPARFSRPEREARALPTVIGGDE